MDYHGGGEAVFSDQVLLNGIAIPAILTSGGRIRWTEVGGSNRQLIVEKEVLGFSVEGSKIKVKAIVEKPGGTCCVGVGGVPMRKSFVFETLSEESLRLWCQKLQECIDSLNRPKRLFVFLNPFGGKKSASKIFLDEVKPLLDDANVEFTLLETQYQLHAKEVAQSLDFSKYDGIVCVSGDGILVEVVNGLLQRKDWKDAISTPLGIVPAGTGNGMAKSLLDSVGLPCTATDSILAIIRGHKRSLDVATILQGDTKFFSVLMLAWGLVADTDIESEKYRWMGSARLDFYGLQRILRLRRYNGQIHFVPAPGFETIGEPCGQKGVAEAYHSNKHVKEGEQAGYEGPVLDLETSNWRSLNGPFISVWLHNVPWGSEDTMAAPNAQFSDGYIDAIISRDCPSKLGLLSLMSNMNNGNHVKSPYVMYFKVKAFVLEPGSRTDDQTKGGIIDSDGEVLARGNGTYKCDQKSLMTYDKLQLTVDQGLATIFTPV
ncbi:sphingosine kinase 1-like [Impatiens glandulifera]|uniref:sphingosine kinase 1-like n=1 Tax=Impatiens glandulifera TaxID=253017 RepID=UPI001FB17001|nr:sphingosine kinase 1-like [Impatiens glandulifera]